MLWGMHSSALGSELTWAQVCVTVPCQVPWTVARRERGERGGRGGLEGGEGRGGSEGEGVVGAAAQGRPGAHQALTLRGRSSVLCGG